MREQQLANHGADLSNFKIMTTMDQVQGEVLQGRIDILILNAQIWVFVIEAKNSTFALSIAHPPNLPEPRSNLPLTQNADP